MFGPSLIRSFNTAVLSQVTCAELKSLSTSFWDHLWTLTTGYPEDITLACNDEHPRSHYKNHYALYFFTYFAVVGLLSCAIDYNAEKTPETRQTVYLECDCGTVEEDRTAESMKKR